VSWKRINLERALSLKKVRQRCFKVTPLEKPTISNGVDEIRGSMAKKRKQEENSDTLGWMITFSDLITLMFTFFVLLLSLCSLEAGKIKQMQSACVEAIGILFEGQYSEVEFKIVVSSKKRIKKKVLETENLLKQFSGMKARLLDENQQGSLEFEEKEEGLCIIMRDDLLFNIGRAEINPESVSVLKQIGNSFKNFEGGVMVEGHTDNLPIDTERFPSNWELSTARAVSVVRYLTEEVGVDPMVLSAVGYGDTKPRVPNDTPENRRKNRRVKIILVPQIV
jgi:chemotaxis protein MotB